MRKSLAKLGLALPRVGLPMLFEKLAPGSGVVSPDADGGRRKLIIGLLAVSLCGCTTLARPGPGRVYRQAHGRVDPGEPIHLPAGQ